LGDLENEEMNSSDDTPKLRMIPTESAEKPIEKISQLRPACVRLRLGEPASANKAPEGWRTPGRFA
jgi:hypothetical protein